MPAPVRVFEFETVLEQSGRNNPAALQNEFGFRTREDCSDFEHPLARRFGVRASSSGNAVREMAPLAEALGRLLYLVDLAVLLWWLLDKRSHQRAIAALVSLTQQLLPSAALTLRVPSVRRFVIAVDELVREALFGSSVST